MNLYMKEEVQEMFEMQIQPMIYSTHELSLLSPLSLCQQRFVISPALAE